MSTIKENQPPYFKAIIVMGLITGTLDIIAAIIQVLTKGGSPIKMLQFIASGAFGKESFSGGLLYAFLGLLLHYCIATGWSFLFFLLYPKVKILSKNWIITGIVYGFLIWLVMNKIVLPLVGLPSISPSLSQVLINISILVIAIGLPLSFKAKKISTNN